MKDWRLLARKNIWVILGLLTLVLRWVLGRFPEFTERFYSRGLFLGIRWLLDHSIGFLPFPFSYLLFLALLAWIFLRLRRWWISRRHESLPLKKRLLKAIRQLFALVGALIFFFFWLWGFNYQRLPVADHLGLSFEEPSSEQLQEAVAEVGRQAGESRQLALGAVTDSLSPSMLGPNLELRVREALTNALQKLDYPVPSQVRARFIRPGGWMLRWNIAGIYNPFSGEGNVSAALTPVQYPFTMAHELSHGYGFSDEGTCNFLAALACTNSEDLVVQYCGWTSLWRYLAYELRKQDPEAYKAAEENLAKGVRTDIDAARRNSRRYQGSLSRAGAKVNDAYLKAQGVKGGLANYNRVVLLYMAWKKSGGWAK